MNDPPVNDLDQIYHAVLENNKLLQEIVIQLSLLEETVLRDSDDRR